MRVSANLSDFQKEIQGLEKQWNRTGSQLQNIGSKLTAGVTLPLVAIGASAVAAAAKFESSFAGVRKTVDATDAEFAQMSQQFRDLALEIPVSVNELNRLGEAAGALGIPKGEIVEFARVMALLGVTTNLTSDQAAEGIAKIQNIFGASGKDTDRFAATLVALGNAGASTETQILEMATRIAGAGSTIGLTQGEVLGFASALSSVGLEADAGGTAISRVFIDMASAVSRGGRELQQFAAVAGMTAEGFTQTFRQDASGAVAAFIDGLGRIKESGGDLIGTLAEMGVTEVRLRDTLLRLAGAGDLFSSSLRTQDEAWRSNSALTKEAAERFKTFESQMTLLRNKVNDLAIDLGQQLIPHLLKIVDAAKPVLDVMVGLIKQFASLPPEVQTTALGMLAFSAALGPISFVFGSLLKFGSSVLALFRTLGITMAGVTSAASVIGPALAVAATALGSIKLGSFIAELRIGSLAIGDWVEFLAAWRLGLAGVSAENVKLAISARRLAELDVPQLPARPDLSGGRALPGMPVDIDQAFLMLNGDRATEITGRLSVANEKLAASSKRAAEEQKRLHDEMLATAVAAERELTSFEFFQTRAAMPLQQALGGLGVQWNDLTEAIIPTSHALTGMEPVLADLGREVIGLGGTYLPQMNIGLTETEQRFITAAKEGKSFGDFLKNDLGKIIIGAFQGGGDVGRSIGGALGGFLTGPNGVVGRAVAGIGGTLGSVLGSVLPGLGTILGGLVGSGLGKLFGKLFNNPERQINPIREAFVQAAGGLDQLNQKAAAAGVTLTRLLDARTPEAYKAAIDELTAAFAFQDEAMATLQETVQRYGFTIDELGPAMQRQMLGEQAGRLLQDFTVLNAAGIDSAAILARMGENVSTFVQQALRTGTEIPAAMRPMLEQFAASGQLFDENGQQITDLGQAGLVFSETMTQGFAKVVESVNRLAEAIARGLGIALDGVTDQARAAADAIGSIPVPSIGSGIWDGGGGIILDESGNVINGGGGDIPVGPDTRSRFVSSFVPPVLTPGELAMSSGSATPSGPGSESVALLADIRSLLSAGRHVSVQVDGREIVKAEQRVLDEGGSLLSQQKAILGVV